MTPAPTALERLNRQPAVWPPRRTAAAVLPRTAVLPGAGVLTVAAVLAAAAACAVAALAPSTASALSAPSINPVPPPAPAPTSATIAPSLSPDRLGARASLTFSISYAGGEFGVPSPVRHSVLRFPAGMSLDIPSLRACKAARLRAHGPRGCPAGSEIGSGRALAETHAGSQITTEEVELHAFLGPPENLQPTFEIFAQGYTPLDEDVVFGGKVDSANAPYGEELVMSIPPVPSLPLEPDASIVTFSLTVGRGMETRPPGTHPPHGQSAVSVPRRCPAGGFPFAAEFTYADGSDSSTLARVPCP
jgi:hypothetical protein